MSRALSLWVVATLVALSAPALATQTITSTFDANNEGWLELGDATTTSPTWGAAYGRGGGGVRLVDSGSGGVMYFAAPLKFLGDQSGMLGGTLSFDLKESHASNPFNSSDVVLVGGGITLVYDTAFNPATGSFTAYEVPLSVPGWRIDSLSGAAATATQMTTVLHDLTALRIRAEYSQSVDTGYLDNVVMRAPEPLPVPTPVPSPVPESSSLALALVGLMVLGLSRAPHRRT